MPVRFSEKVFFNFVVQNGANLEKFEGGKKGHIGGVLRHPP